ncbi:hypothetical protein ADT71_00075 [Novosphingobium sp. ST904]|nr:hypothetical protein ADT71_00075 [Novosphingobium sp. ST904]
MADIPQPVIANDIGLGLLPQAQRLRRIDRRSWRRLAVDKAMQHVENVGLGGNTGLQSQLDRAQHGLLVVMQNERKYLDHLPVATRALEQMAL